MTTDWNLAFTCFLIICCVASFVYMVKTRHVLQESRDELSRYREEMARLFDEYHLVIARGVFLVLKDQGFVLTDESEVDGITYKQVSEYFEEKKHVG